MKTLEMGSHELPRHIYGIDFSGAKDAGKKIWIARGVIHNGILHIDKCDSAGNILGEDRLLPCLNKLQKFIYQEKNCVFGFDFPFGIQKDMVQRLFGVVKWDDFVKYFYEEFYTPDKFRKACRKISHKPELKRETDIITATPFSPYNIRVYKQTNYGIRNVLYPLMTSEKVSILPMLISKNTENTIIEICPASTLKKLFKQKRPCSYKGRTDKDYENKKLILDKLEDSNLISIPDSILDKVLKNNSGDALDSVIAAYATFCAWRNHFAVEDNEKYDVEGCVFA